ncbi:hypothetical protein IO98_14955 [Lacrimispora celerecrescens]|uniref:Uncharacterized protein n=1 Tax=Lacrimispora celerecrescens TaxID=29354 RepID=A0A084JJZ9_9FIRM|nr:hypothetical protein IO98_14955 [Lacrimispora celerecrescens]
MMICHHLLKKNSTVRNYKKKLNQLMLFFNDNREQYNTIIQTNLDENFKSLNIKVENYSKTNDDNDRINETLSKEFNQIRRFLISTRE